MRINAFDQPLDARPQPRHNHGQQVESANSWKQNDLLRLTNPWSWCFEQPAANNLRSAHGGMVNVSQTLQYRTERTRMIGVGESSPNAAGWLQRARL